MKGSLPYMSGRDGDVLYRGLTISTPCLCRDPACLFVEF